MHFLFLCYPQAESDDWPTAEELEVSDNDTFLNYKRGRSLPSFVS